FKIKQNSKVLRYYLASVIYFGHDHFTANIIKLDGQVWYYDGMTNGGRMKFMGSLTDSFDLKKADGKRATAAIYILL
ncbi:hypothetical protein CPB84DRAFT_1646491, partial [Gymnopilus junonius]